MPQVAIIVDGSELKKQIDQFIAGQRSGVDFTVFPSLSEADGYIREGSVDLIIADVSIVRNTEDLTQNYPDVPIVLLVERSETREALNGLHAGVADFLIKDAVGDFLQLLTPTISKTLLTFQEREACRRKNQELKIELQETLEILENETRSHQQTLIELLKSNEIYRNLVETGFERTWEIDSGLRYVFTSSQVFTMLGYTQEETLGRTPFDFMVADVDKGESVKSLETLFKRECPFSLVEKVYLHKDGHQVILETNAKPLFTSGGKFKGFRGVDRDITARKNAIDQLEKTLAMQKTINALMRISLEPASYEEQLHHALDHILACKFNGMQDKGAIFTVEDDPAMLELQIQRGFSDELITACSRVPFGTCICGRAAKKKKCVGFRCNGDDHDIKIPGAEPHNHCCIPILRGDEVLGLINLYLDFDCQWGEQEEEFMMAMGRAVSSIIMKHRSDENTKKLLAQIAYKKKMETISRMAESIAHEFNNPLTAISGYSQMILMDCEEDSELYANVSVINDSSKKIAGTVNQLLAFSQEQKAVPIQVSVNDILDKLADAIRSLVGENIAVSMKLAEDLWEVKIDYAQVDQLILNMVENVRDALHENFGHLEITTTNVNLGYEFVHSHPGSKPGEYVKLTFKDDGPGMPLSVSEKVFEPFFSTRNEKRYGLGLSTVYGILKSNGGNIYVDSEPGKGSVFDIYLPRYLENDDRSTDYTDPYLEGGAETILVVDDEEEILKYIRRVLGSIGYNILVAEDGYVALRCYEEHAGPIALLLTDVYMPRMNGLELAEKLRVRQNDIKVLYMSGYADNPDVHRDIIANGADYMSKPISPQRLSSAVRMILDMA